MDRVLIFLLVLLMLSPALLLAQTVTSTTTTTAPAPVAPAPVPPPVPTPVPQAVAPPPGAPAVIVHSTTTVKGPETVTTQTTTVAIKDPENTLFLDTTYGRVVIELRPDLAPKTVARIKELTRKNFYDGLLFHRVIDGFMAQTGDPKGDGTGGSGQKLGAEFNVAKHVRGVVSMARAADPDSADSQFFIVTGNASFLDGQYTAFGQVLSGMEFVDQLKKGARANNGMVQGPDKIVTMRVAADVKP